MTIYQPGSSITITADTTLYAVWVGIPSAMTWKIWDGDSSEHFTYEDMNRITANLLALEGCFSTSSWSVSSFETVSRSSMFSYAEAQKVEDAITELASAIGVSVSMATNWVALRGIDYRDFERWESSAYKVYQAMGGTSTRIDA